jgi:hypothetical protein
MPNAAKTKKKKIDVDPINDLKKGTLWCALFL